MIGSFDCDTCMHTFQAKIYCVTRINLPSWCTYCTNKKLCDNENCKICLDKSFLSHPKSKYWDMIKILLIGLIAFEMLRYIDANKKLGGEPSPITLAVFGLLIFALASFTFPGLIAVIKSCGNFGGMR